MDFEKLYKEALGRAKAGKPMDEVFPELKESEDERIRKHLLTHFKNKTKETWCCMPVKDIVAYLERKKDEVQNQFTLGVQAGREEVMYEIEKEQKIARWKPLVECLNIPDGHYVVGWFRFGDFRLGIMCNGLFIDTNGNRAEQPKEVFYIPNANEKFVYVEQEPTEWKPQPESLEALMYAIEGKWEMIKPTSYLSRRLEDLYEGIVNTFNVNEVYLEELPKVASTGDIEELKALKRKIEASMDEKPAEWIFDNRIQYDSIKSGIEVFSKTYSFNIESRLTPSLSEEQMKIWRKEIEQAVIAGGEMGIELKNDNRYEENKISAEWSGEDEKYLNLAINIVASDLGEDSPTVSWLKSLRPQPKQEWSEEDEKNLKQCIEIIGGWEIDYDNANPHYSTWLKSLRPQPHWKPSKEQMKHLERCFSHGHTSQLPNQHVLESLYHDLKLL